MVGVVAIAAMTPAAAELSGGVRDARPADVVIIRAETATQDDSQDGYRLNGNFVMLSDEWEIRADRASVSGRLADPARVELEGAPASLTILRDAGRDPFHGLGESVVFLPHEDVVTLDGAASVVSGRQSITSESIRYWLERETFAAGAGGRVRVVTEPGPDGVLVRRRR